MENKKRTIYGRRKSRPLSDCQKKLWNDLFEVVKIDPQKLPIEYPEKVLFEVGFGSGENIAYQAINNPDYMCIGCEPFINGISSLLVKIKNHSISNIKIYNDDAKILLEAMPDHTISKFFILFPDPWPKKRHNRRRFINSENLSLIHKKMKHNGELIIATDHPGYLEWILEIIKTAEFMDNFETIHSHNQPRPDCTDIPITRYEKKALEGLQGAFFKFTAI